MWIKKMKLNTFKLSKIMVVITVIGLISILSTLFLPSNIHILSTIIAIPTMVIGCIGIIVITYQDVKYGEISLKKANVKRWLKEYYKLIIFMVIYTVIMSIVFIVIEIIYALIISGIVLGIMVIAFICNEVYFRISIRKLENIE